MNKRLSQLNDYLATLIVFSADTLPFLRDAGIDVSLINFGSSPLTFWNSIISYADNNLIRAR